LEAADHKSRSWGELLKHWVPQWLLFWGAWVLFTSSFSLAELVIGVFAAAAAATASHLVWMKGLAQVAAHWRWFIQVWRLPKYGLTGTYEILAVLARHLFTSRKAESLLFVVPFDAGGSDDDSATRRALAIALTTITPNFVVIGIDEEKGLLVYHQIAKSPVPQMTKVLGARP
jgi:multisubunit Na+/H+ antiporter MnhE subunit